LQASKVAGIACFPEFAQGEGAQLVAQLRSAGNTDPFNIAVADSISDRTKRLANEVKYLLSSNLLQQVR